jgi:hypothetical protein
MKLENVIENPILEFEISECDSTLDEIIEAIENAYCGFKFNHTEARYETCIFAIFEKR